MQISIATRIMIFSHGNGHRRLFVTCQCNLLIRELTFMFHYQCNLFSYKFILSSLQFAILPITEFRAASSAIVPFQLCGHVIKRIPYQCLFHSYFISILLSYKMCYFVVAKSVSDLAGQNSSSREKI